MAGRGAAIAVPAPARVGIDLERSGSVRGNHGRYFLRSDERALARRLGLTAMWSLKEAAWKACGASADTPFRALALHADRKGRLEAISLHGRRTRARASLSRPWRGFVVAVVWLEEGA